MRTLFERRVVLATAVAVAALSQISAALAQAPYPTNPPRIDWGVAHTDGGPSLPPIRQHVGRFTLADVDSKLEQAGASMVPIQVLKASCDRYIATADGKTRFATLWFSYTLRRGQALPMLDSIYRVDDNSRSDTMHLTRAADKDAAKNPTSDRNTVVVPVGTYLRFIFDEDGEQLAETSVLDITKVTGGDNPPRPLRARISLWNGTASNDPERKLDAAVGANLPLVLGCQLTVKKIVPPDEKHSVLGWVEFGATPAGQESAIYKNMFHQIFSDAGVGTDPAFEKVLAASQVRKGLLAPLGMRGFVASRKDLLRIAGPVRLEMRADDSAFLLCIWTFDADFRGDKADGVQNARNLLVKLGFAENRFIWAPYLARLWRSHVIPESSTPFGAHAAGETRVGAYVSQPTQVAVGNARAYRQHFVWAVIGRRADLPPTLRQLVEACSMLKPPPSERPFDDFLGDKQIWSLSVSFADAPAAGWSVETVADVRPELHALLAKLGFEQSPNTIRVPLPNNLDGTERHIWRRQSDASSVSITPLGDRIQIDCQGPKPRK